MFTRTKAKPTAPAGPITAAVTHTAPCQRSLEVRVTPEGLSPIRDEIIGSFQREAALPGFRKGKAPRELVEQRYTQEIRDELLKQATRRALEQATVEHQFKPLGPFEISQVRFADATGLAFRADVEIEPDFTLGDYRGLTATRPAAVVSADDVQRALAQLQESMAELVPVAEGQPKEKRVPALDDELAKDLRFENLAKLTEHVEAKLREQRRAEQAQAIEQTLCDALLARHPFDLPPKLVEHQTERLKQEIQARLLLGGTSEDAAKAELATHTEALRQNAVRHVRLSFILDRIAEAERITPTQDELVDRLWTLARRWGKDPAEIRALFDAQGLWPSVMSSLRHEKTLQFIVRAAQIEDAGAAPSAI